MDVASAGTNLPSEAKDVNVSHDMKSISLAKLSFVTVAVGIDPTSPPLSNGITAFADRADAGRLSVATQVGPSMDIAAAPVQIVRPILLNTPPKL
jgi:hypothetical protein